MIRIVGWALFGIGTLGFVLLEGKLGLASLIVAAIGIMLTALARIIAQISFLKRRR
jgi:hypothetical protein